MYRFLDPHASEHEKPKFCSKCRGNLINKSLPAGYDIYTGTDLYKEFLMCEKTALVDSHHDVWELNTYALPSADQSLVEKNF